ncbi:MAG: Gfo/Idh/MocA family oxidoreductase [Balneolaceae bacterium]
MKNMNRRTFIKNSAIVGIGSTAALSFPGILKGSPNETLNFAVAGVRSRGKALTQAIHAVPNAKITFICDVDDNIISEHKKFHEEETGYIPQVEKDFRKLVEFKDVDVIAIATPEHWHAPMAIMAMEAGKHVYIEKPCSHNPFENDLLVKAQKKYGKLCQMGNQQRSSTTSRNAVTEIRDGRIGDVYYAKAWYSSTRGSIGTGKVIPVPDYLDWELWQGPAPRQDYRDNIHPYNWHWFKNWGTGEIHNNGTHEIDICRWALGVDLPKKVASTGGRLHFNDDDWEYFDTQNASFEFDGNKMITWEGKSCNGQNYFGRGRGAMIHGTKGSILLDRAGTILYDLEGNILKEEKEDNKYEATDTADRRGFDGLTVQHMQNLADGIREGEELAAPIDDASISTMLCHLGNISQEIGRSLEIDPASGKIKDDTEAMKLWKREYEPGWEPRI